MAPLRLVGLSSLALAAAGLAGLSMHGGVLSSSTPAAARGRLLVDAAYGQSNATQSYSGVVTRAAARAADATLITAITGPAGGTQRTAPLKADAPLGGWAAVAARDRPGAALVFVAGGQPGTSIAVRGPDSTPYALFHKALTGAGGTVRYIYWIDGESDRGRGAAYQRGVLRTIEALDATAATRPKRYVFTPVGWTKGSDAATDDARRAQAELAFRHPDRIVIGSWSNDLPHRVVRGQRDLVHLSPDGNAIAWRRRAMMASFLDRRSPYHLAGPRLRAAARRGADAVDVSFDLETLDRLALRNAGAGGDYAGGLRFARAGDPGFTAKLRPVAATVLPPVQGRQTIRFRFAPGQAAGPILVGGPAGSRPFNPAADLAIDADLAGRAVMVVGIHAGEAPVAVQPYFDFASGQDYLTAG